MIADRRFVIIGAGMLGRTLAAALRARGLTVVAVASRRLEAAQAAAELAGCDFATTDVVAAARRGDMVVLSVPDDAIATVCEQVADGGGFTAGDVAVHLSGALGSDALDAARRCGAGALAFHPAQTFARVDPTLFGGIVCAIEGDAEAAALGCALAELLGSRPVSVRAEDKALYHAALCVASNYAVTLADAGGALLEEAGFGDAALATLMPLLRAILDNLGRVGPPKALTGPISRGDTTTLREHLAQLEARMPDLLPLYCVVGLRTIDVALRKGTIDAAQAEAMRALLADRPRGGSDA